MAIIDIHGHFMPIVNEPWYPASVDEAGMLKMGNRPAMKVNPGLLDLSKQVEAMEKLGVSFRILHPAPQSILYNLSADESIRFCRAFNDKMAEEVKKYPKYFAATANLPMMSTEAAVAELTRCVQELGMKGAQIGSNIMGKELDDPSLIPFWEKVVELDVPILMHSTNPAGGERLRDFYLANMIGNRFEVTLASCRLIFGGIMDRFPTLKIIVGQGGGYLPYAAGRMDHAWRVEEAPKKNVKVPPSTYIPKFYYDSITQRESEFHYLVSQVGLDQVAVGMDAPYDMGDPNPNETVVKWLNDDAKLERLNNTARRLFKL